MRASCFILLACCAGRSEPLPPLDPPGPRMSEVVATWDGAPVTRGDVVQTALEIDFPNLLRRHLMRRLIEAKRRELGIENSPDELSKFALAWTREFKTRQPADFEQALKDSKKTEVEFACAYAKEPALAARLANEKIVAYALLTQDALQVDAGPRVWVVRGMLQGRFGKQVEEEAFRSEEGATVGPVHIVRKTRGSPRSYKEAAADVLARILLAPLDDATVESYFEWLLSRADIRILKPK